jgi:glutamate synthase domain-containing protein 3
MEEKVSRTNEINRAILKQMEVSTKIKIGGAGLTGQDNIAVGLRKEIELIVEGEAGDFFGALNQSAILNLNGNAGRFVGDCMSGGGVIINGNAGFGVGSYLGGGIIVIRGDCADKTGQMKKGGVIIIDGNVGENAGYLQSEGEMIITGSAGKGLGEFLIGGTIYVGGEYESLGNNTKIVEMELSDINLLDTYFSHYGITSKATTFSKIIPISKEPFELMVTGGTKSGEEV